MIVCTPLSWVLRLFTFQTPMSGLLSTPTSKIAFKYHQQNWLDRISHASLHFALGFFFIFTVCTCQLLSFFKIFLYFKGYMCLIWDELHSFVLFINKNYFEWSVSRLLCKIKSNRKYRKNWLHNVEKGFFCYQNRRILKDKSNLLLFSIKGK